MVWSLPLRAAAIPSVVQLEDVCSAVLMHPRVLLYSAHCGEQLQYASAHGERLEIERCESFPDGGLFGNDLAFCVLREPVLEVPIVAPALGCELQAITPGRSVWLAGFGADQRIRRGELQEVGDELAVTGLAACAGDSGGPLLVEVDDGAGRALRIAGVLSSSAEEQCTEATAYFTPLWPLLAWVEQQSGFDLSPCGAADGTWNPSADCQSLSAALLDADDCDASYTTFTSTTCGPAAAQDASPSYLTKQQNTASCQSVFGERRSLTTHVLGLTTLALCGFGACFRRRFR